MKERFTKYFLVATLAFFSCSKIEKMPSSGSCSWSDSTSLLKEDSQEIVFNVRMNDAPQTKATVSDINQSHFKEGAIEYMITEEPFEEELVTKATAILSPSGLWYWGATTGGNAAGTEMEIVKWEKESAEIVEGSSISDDTSVEVPDRPIYPGGGKIDPGIVKPVPGTDEFASITAYRLETGKNQTTEPSYNNYYVTNCSTLNIGYDTFVSIPDNEIDYIAGRIWNSSDTMPEMTLEHLFVRTGTISVNTSNNLGYTFSNITVALKSADSMCGTAGRFSLRRMAWTARQSAFPLTVLGANVSSMIRTNLYLIPGNYGLVVSFRVHNGSKYLDVTQEGILPMTTRGHRYNINISFTMDFSWTDNPIDDWDDGWDDDPEINL